MKKALAKALAAVSFLAGCCGESQPLPWKMPLACMHHYSADPKHPGYFLYWYECKGCRSARPLPNTECSQTYGPPVGATETSK
jgi:hypothetical protein